MLVKVTRAEESRFTNVLDKLKDLSNHFEVFQFNYELYEAFCTEGSDLGLDISDDIFTERFYPIVIGFKDKCDNETSNISDFKDWYWGEFRKVKNKSEVISVEQFSVLVNNFCEGKTTNTESTKKEISQDSSNTGEKIVCKNSEDLEQALRAKVDEELKDPVFGKHINTFAAYAFAKQIVNWHKEQMLKDAVIIEDELVMCYNNGEPMGLSPYKEWWETPEVQTHFKDGDKVKVIIVKDND